MAISQQKIHVLNVKRLKVLENLELSFGEHLLTAILGPNGNGKSTILHALACSFEPNTDGENYKFTNFFLPSTDALWKGSEFQIEYSFREGANEQKNVIKLYSKKIDRWAPRYASRPKRDVLYIGIDKCVPMIELEKKQAKINYSTTAVDESIINTILEKASIILNRKYVALNIHNASGKTFIGVEVEGLRYSALSMSAGEQKVFYILEKLYKAPKYSLLLIDEIDLLLHDKAMKNLIFVMNERANQKNIQIVFTTHRESVIDLENYINIRHIVTKPGKTLCFNETKPDAINRLTGEQPRPLEIFVEDDLASAIVKKVASKLRLSKFVSIQRYGAAINCFTTVAGLLLGGDTCECSIFLLDGDVYRSEEEKTERINRIITGHDDNAISCRDNAKSKIYQLNLPIGVKPEQYLHSIIISIPESENDEFNEIIEAAKEIVVANESHKYLNDIIERLGWDRNTGLSKIVDLLSIHDFWPHYVLEINNWLNQIRDITREDHSAA